jgi:bleomycin hydrolase
VRHTYAYKAERFVRYQGKVNFGEGGLAHDAINALATHGIVPETVYNGRKNNGPYDHSELVKNVEKQLKTALAAKPFDADYLKEINTTLNAEMGAPPTEFMYNSQPYTPLRFAQELGLDANNYVSLTSYTHHKFYAPFVLEVPDNFSHGAFYNLPLNELTGVVDAALAAGYTVAWDADVSNEGFNHKESLALLPAPDERKPFKKPCIEQAVTQATRQQAFDTQSVTDDHLMHIVGTATDQKGRQYYVIKNSWGDDSNETKGYLYCSKAYFEMNTVSVLLNKKAIGDGLRTKLGL